MNSLLERESGKNANYSLTFAMLAICLSAREWTNAWMAAVDLKVLIRNATAKMARLKRTKTRAAAAAAAAVEAVKRNEQTKCVDRRCEMAKGSEGCEASAKK